MDGTTALEVNFCGWANPCCLDRWVKMTFHPVLTPPDGRLWFFSSTDPHITQDEGSIEMEHILVFEDLTDKMIADRTPTIETPAADDDGVVVRATLILENQIVERERQREAEEEEFFGRGDSRADYWFDDGWTMDDRQFVAEGGDFVG